MNLWLSFLLLFFGLTMLAGASGIVVSNLVAASKKRRLKKSILSFLLISFSTSFPELSVAFNAILARNMSVSLGDIIGSNITNISLVVGLCLVVASLNRSNKMINFWNAKLVKEEEKREFITGLMLVSITLLMLLYLQYISRVIGILLLGVFLSYSYILFQKRKITEEDLSYVGLDRGVKRELLLIFIGILGVILGAKFTVESAIRIAYFFAVPSSIIGATLVALGTSLPELVVDARAAFNGYLEITIGDIVGSCFLNSTLILGLLLTFTPLEVNMLVLSDLILFSVVSNLLLWYFLDNGNMWIREGFILLTIYTVNLLTILGILVLRVH